MGVTPDPGVGMTDSEGCVGLACLQGSCQLLIQAKQVALAVGARAYEPRHGPLGMPLQKARAKTMPLDRIGEKLMATTSLPLSFS